MIIIGFLIGPVFGWISPNKLQGVAGTFATVAIIIILIDSGLDFDISVLIKKMFDAAIFTVIVNVLITVVVGSFVHFFFGWNLLHGLLLGIVSSGTTTVMVMTLLEGLNVNKETKNLLVLESILNDTTLIIIAITLIGMIKQNTGAILDSIVMSIQNFIKQISLGIIIPIFFFFIWLELIKLIPAQKKRNYVFLLGILFVLFGVVEFFKGSGVVGVMVFSLLLGNLSSIAKFLNLKEKYYTKDHLQSLRSIKLIQLDFSFFIKTFFFVFLGMMTNIELVSTRILLIVGSVIGLMIVTRYISVHIMTFIDKKYKSHAFLISTMVPRGFVATLLAFLPLNEGIQIEPGFTEIVMLLIFFTSIVSIFGTIIFRTKLDPELNKQKDAEKA